MQRYQCRSCGGTYYDAAPDGAAYFHGCPSGTTNPRDERPVSVVTRDARTGVETVEWHPALEGKGRVPYVEPPPAEPPRRRKP